MPNLVANTFNLPTPPASQGVPLEASTHRDIEDTYIPYRIGSNKMNFILINHYASKLKKTFYHQRANLISVIPYPPHDGIICVESTKVQEG